MSFENPTQTPESQKTPSAMIELPPHIAEANAQSDAARKAEQDARLADARERAEAIARSIDASRPEGMPSTLPTGEKKPDSFLGASTVNSHSGIRIDTHA